MRRFMIVQGRLLSKRLPTEITFVRLLTRMNSSMGQQCTSLRESFLAHVTWKRTMTRMYSLVDGEIVRVLEKFPAKLTLEDRSVCFVLVAMVTVVPEQLH